MLNQEQLRVFESPYWKPGEDSRNRVVMSEWQIKQVSYLNQPAKPRLSLQVLTVNGESARKEFQTGNRDLIRKLWLAIDLAQKQGYDRIDVIINRAKGNDYQVVDMRLVEQTARGTI